MMRKFRPPKLLLMFSLMVSPMAALAQPDADAGVGGGAVAPLVDIFAARTWEPPPVVAEPAAPAAPQAPPLPFQFLGRIVDAERGAAYLLADGARVVVVGVGDRIGKDYRVEKYEKGQLLFRYRPMNLRQALEVGEKK